MIGYKVFNSRWQAVLGKGGHSTPYQYKLGEIYEEKEKPHARHNGFHFCQDLISCFNYYGINTQNRIGLLEILGDVDQNGDAFATNKMRLVREIPWREAIKIIEEEAM